MSPHPVNILLVDDQPAKLLSYEVILKDLGENLLKASSGREALGCMLKNDIAVVLIDVCMPGLDGFELAGMIRDHPRFHATSIIFVSAISVTEVDHLKGYQLGAVDYVPVPVEPDLLRAKVRVFVGNAVQEVRRGLAGRELAGAQGIPERDGGQFVNLSQGTPLRSPEA